MRKKAMINFMAGLLFALIFSLNSGAFAYLPSGADCPASEVVFIDPSVRDAEIIVAQLPENAEVVRLRSDRDGVAQISAHLGAKRSLSAIHLISHGNPGHFVLNGRRVDTDFLRDHGDRISTWGRALAEKGDILLYACNLASSDEGKAFVKEFARLTGADTAASTDITGGEVYHGNWNLEYTIGPVEALSISVAPSIAIKLDTYTWTGASSSDWTLADNWGGAAPIATDDIVIPNAADTANDPNIDGAYTYNDFTIQDGGIVYFSDTDSKITTNGDLYITGNGSGTGAVIATGDNQIFFDTDTIQKFTSAKISSESGNVTLNNADSLQIVTSLEISSTAGNILFSNFDTIEAGSGSNTAFLTIAAGTGTVNLNNTFNGTAGTDSSLTISSASQVDLANVQVESNISVTADNIDLNGTIYTGTGGAVTFTGAVDLDTSGVSTVTVTSGGGADDNISFTSTINGNTDNQQSLTLVAGASGTISVGGIVGGTASKQLATLTVTSSNGATFDDAVTTDTSVVLTDTTNDANITFTGALVTPTLTTLGERYDLDLHGSETIITNDLNFLNTGIVTLGNDAADELTFNGGLATTGNATNPGTVKLAGTVQTSGDQIDMAALSITDNATISTGADSAGAINITGAVTGTSTDNLTLEAGSGTLTLSSTVGAGNEIGVISVTADELVISDTMTGQGAITLAPSTATTVISLGSGATGFDLSAAEIARITTSSTATIGSTGAGTITVGADITPSGASGDLHLKTGGGITGTAGGIIQGNLALTAAGTINFTDASTDVDTLAVSDSGQTVTFTDADGIDLGSVGGITGVTATTFELTTSGAITDSQASTISGVTTVAAGSGNNVTLNHASNNFSTLTVTSGNDVTINDTDALTITDVTNTLGGKLDLTAGGSGITINDTAITTTTTQDYNSHVILGSDIVLTSSSDSITFNSTIAGSASARNFTASVVSGKKVSLGGDITTNIGTITKQGAGDFDTGNNAITATGLTVSAGTFNNDGDATGVWDINGTVEIASGATLKAPSGTFTVSGDWSNSGAFTHGNNTVTFDGVGTSVLTGSTGFYNMTCTTAGKNLTFTDGTTQTIEAGGTLTLTGASGSDNLITLQGSGTAGWNITDSGTESVSYVDVSYSAASSSITASNSKDSGNNTNWVFSANTITWDGSTDTDWDTAANWNLDYVPKDSDNVIIANVANDPVLGSATTTNNLTINADAVLTLNGLNLTVNGTYSNSGTLQLNGDETVVSLTNDPDSGLTEFVSTADITIKNLSPYYNVEFDASGAGTAVFTLPAAIEVNNNLVLTDGTLDVSGNNYAITVSGDWSGSGTFQPRAGTVTLNGTDQALGASTFYNLTTTGTGKQTVGGTVTVENTLNTGTGTTFALGSNTLNIGSANTGTGSWTNSGTFQKDTGTVNYAENGDQSILALDYSTLALSSTTEGATKTFADGTTKVDNDIEIAAADVNTSMTLTGSSASAVTVQVTVPGAVGTASRVFNVNASGETVTIENVTIRGGDISGEGDVAAGYGGGIYVAAGTLNLDTVTVSLSKATVGGGIFSATTLTINDSSIVSCTSTKVGAGMYFEDGTLNITGSTIANNTAAEGGGGIKMAGVNSTLTANITNSTISGNTAIWEGGGLAVWNNVNLTITNSTIANNHSDNGNFGGISRVGGGVYQNEHTGSSLSLTMKNTILSNNYRGSGTGTGDDYYYTGDGALIDSGYNVVGYSNVAANATGGFNATTDILYNTKNGQAGTSFSSWTTGTDGGTAVSGSLGLSSTLADNGGPTDTLAIESQTSIAVGNGYYDVAVTTTDQRGATRHADGQTIGAYEFYADYTTNGSGTSWNTAVNWNMYNGVTTPVATVAPNADNSTSIGVNHNMNVDADVSIDQTTVAAGKTLTVDANQTLTVADGTGTDLTATGGLAVNANGTLLINSGAFVDSNGAFTSSGTVSFNAASGADDGTLNLAGASPTLGTLTKGQGTVTYDDVDQAMDGQSYYNVGISGGGTKTLSGIATVDNALALSSGLITLGNNDLTLGAAATVTGTPSASNMIVTNGTGVLKKLLSATGTFIFPVGDSTGTAEYSPATLNFTSGTFADGAYASLNVTNTKQPNNTSTTDYLNRYWTVTESGISGFSCDTTFNYLAADVAGTEADIYGGQYKDSAWTVFDLVNTGTHSFSATVTGFSDFTGVEASTPATQATNISFSSVAQTQMAVNWTRGNGDEVLVVAHQGSAVDSNPVNGTTYTANAVFGSGTQIGTGNYVVYKGTGTSVTVTGLTANTAYHFRAYEFNDAGIEERYITTPSTGNPNNQTTLPSVLTTKVDLTGPSTVTAGALSTAFTLTSQDADGNTENVNADTIFDLSSNSSGTKVFYSNAAGTSVINDVTITNGTSAATFYYKDTNAGTPTLTATWHSGGTDLGSDTLQPTVSLATTTLVTSSSVKSTFRDFKVTVTKIRMGNSGASFVTIFSGTAELDLVNVGTFPGISNIPLPVGTYNQIEVTFKNSLPVAGTLTYSGTTYYTTTATFGGASNVASSPTDDLGSQTVFTFRISDWGALDVDVTQTFDITPITVDASTDYQPTLRFTISKTFLLKGTAGAGSTYYFELSAPTVSIVEP